MLLKSWNLTKVYKIFLIHFFYISLYDLSKHINGGDDAIKMLNTQIRVSGKNMKREPLNHVHRWISATKIL